jgi:hypothetical protein
VTQSELVESSKARRDFYRERERRFSAEASVLGARSRLISNLRGVSFAVLVVAGIFAFVVLAIVLLRGRYIRQFRDTLRAGEIHRDAVIPDLDATSSELLTAALASPDELEALAALELRAVKGGRVPVLVE